MEENQRLTGAQLLVQCLQNLGVKNSFGVPGESYLAVLDALHDADIQFTLCRQEGAASFAACAWGKLTDMPGICFVTRGPGATNGSIGVHSARQDSSPMILFVGQVGVDQKDREAFQEVDYRAFFGPLAKWATEIDNAERIPEVVSRAWRLALSGRPGPVVIGLPEEMLTTKTSVQPCQPLEVAEAGDDLSQAAALTRRSDRCSSSGEEAGKKWANPLCRSSQSFIVSLFQQFFAITTSLTTIAQCMLETPVLEWQSISLR